MHLCWLEAWAETAALVSRSGQHRALTPSPLLPLDRYQRETAAA